MEKMPDLISNWRCYVIRIALCPDVEEARRSPRDCWLGAQTPGVGVINADGEAFSTCGELGSVYAIGAVEPDFSPGQAL